MEYWTNKNLPRPTPLCDDPPPREYQAVQTPHGEVRIITKGAPLTGSYAAARGERGGYQTVSEIMSSGHNRGISRPR